VGSALDRRQHQNSPQCSLIPTRTQERPTNSDHASATHAGGRPPLLLYSYIANELLAPFFASFLILYCVFFLVRLIPCWRSFSPCASAFGDFIRLFSYIFPHMLLYIIPMASMAGVIVGFTRLTNDREILALKACGVSLVQMLPPVLLIAAAIACLTGLFLRPAHPRRSLGSQTADVPAGQGKNRQRPQGRRNSPRPWATLSSMLTILTISSAGTGSMFLTCAAVPSP
jgi:hypothetical protein